MKANIIKLSNHDRGRHERYMINHSAIVTIENYDPSEKDEVISTVSMKAGYHPMGYGIYGRSSIESTSNKDEYIVKWKTGDNCD